MTDFPPVPSVPDVVVYAGDTLFFPSYLFETLGVPTDLSEWTFTAQWRPYVQSSTFLDLTIDTTDAPAGYLYVTATADQTTAMNGNGVWDLQGTRTNEVRTFLKGNTIYQLGVTRG